MGDASGTARPILNAGPCTEFRRGLPDRSEPYPPVLRETLHRSAVSRGGGSPRPACHCVLKADGGPVSDNHGLAWTSCPTHRQRINVARTELIGRAHLDEEV